MRNVFPPVVIDRPKVIRKNFLSSWIEKTQLPEIFHLLARGTLVETGMISRPWLLSQIATPQKRAKAFPYLWAILSLEIWFRLYINAPMTSEPPTISLKDLLAET